MTSSRQDWKAAFVAWFIVTLVVLLLSLDGCR